MPVIETMAQIDKNIKKLFYSPMSIKQLVNNTTTILGIFLNEERKKQLAVGNIKVKESLEN